MCDVNYVKFNLHISRLWYYFVLGKEIIQPGSIWFSFVIITNSIVQPTIPSISLKKKKIELLNILIFYIKYVNIFLITLIEIYEYVDMQNGFAFAYYTYSRSASQTNLRAAPQPTSAHLPCDDCHRATQFSPVCPPGSPGYHPFTCMTFWLEE